MPPLAPRPFSQLARRDHRLYGLALRGYSIALGAAPWYRSGRRRRSAFRRNHTALRHFCEWRNFVKRVRDLRPACIAFEVA
jgi:hypothetical protein